MEPIKFLYAADLRLDKPLALGEGGSAFAPCARSAAYGAVRRLVDCAMSRGVNFVLLRGELCDVQCGPKGLLFLTEQMKILSNAGIACYILDEGVSPDVKRLAGFPGSVKWISRQTEAENAGTITCGAHEIVLDRILEPAPPPLQGLAPNETGAGGAWLISFSSSGEPEREFIELDVLRWELCEMDVTHTETEEDFTAAWQAIKNNLREQLKRPVLLHLKLTGVINERSFFYGDDFTRDSSVLMQKLNAYEVNREDFVLVDSLKYQVSCHWIRNGDETGAGEMSPLEEDFWGEVDFFKSSIDLRVGLLDTLKERGLYKRVLAAGAASAGAAALLGNMTEADAESILNEACVMAKLGLHKGGAGLR